jgi:hypothetical protein
MSLAVLPNIFSLFLLEHQIVYEVKGKRMTGVE